MKRSNTFLITLLALLTSAIVLSDFSLAQLTGTKSIPGDYATLEAAILDLNTQGVGSGGVILNLLAGNPQTAPAGGYVVGDTGSLLLTTTNSTDQVIIQGNGNSITASDALTVGALNDAIFKIIGADYITISNFELLENAANTITTAATNNMTEWGIALLYVTTTDGAQNNTINDCIINLDRTYPNTFGIYANATHSPTAVTTSASATGTLGGNSGLVITGNSITDVNMGIVVVGPLAATDHNDVVIIGGSLSDANTITNYGTTGTFSGYVNVSGTVNGILVRNTRNFNISYNSITSSDGGVTSGTINGIQIPAFSNAPTGTFTNSINNNTLSIKSGVIAGAINGINVGGTSASTTSTINIIANDFNNFGHTVAGTAAITFITQAGTHQFQNILNNTFTNLSVNTTGSVTFISNSNTAPANSIKNVNSNSISGTFSKTGAGGTVTLFTDNGSDVVTTTNNTNNNNFSNITVTGATTIAGLSNTNGGSPIKNVVGNTISNLTGGTNAVTAININFDGGITTVSNNVINNITNGGAITGIAFGSSGAGTTSALNNQINALSGSGTGAVNGITIAGGTTRHLLKNNIYNLENSNAAGLVAGVTVSSGTNVYLSNNFISDIKAPNLNAASSLFGLNITGGTNVGLYYNTIYLNASSTGELFGSSAIYASTTPTLDLRNNIFSNLSTPNGATGYTVAYRRSSTTLTSYSANSNNNSFYAGVPGVNNLIFFDGTNADQTISEFKNRVASRDASSFSENVQFVNTTTTPYNLHVDTTIPSQIESGGVTVVTPIAIVDDYDGDLRNVTTPDVGADEFVGTGLDLSAPIISYTLLQNTGSTNERTLVVTVTDPSGVPVTTPGWPNLYWKINSTGTYAAVEPSSVNGSNYSYNFGSGVIANDTVFYYVVAQDNATIPNVGAYPSGGAGGFTINPPAATTPPTSPSSYLITQSGLSGTYTVGLALFNKLSGRDITFEKSVKSITLEVPFEDDISLKNGLPESESTSFTAGNKTTTVSSEEISWIAMDNGAPFNGDLYLKKSENSSVNYPEGTEGVYATLTAAIADLNLRGVSGATTFLLVDSLYNTETLPIVINITNSEITSALNNVTIKPATGVVATITGASASAQVIKILNNYVTIDGSNSVSNSRDLTISNTSTTSPQVLLVGSLGTSPITDVAVKNTNLINGVISSSALVISDGVSPGTAGWFNNITIQNNTIQKAYIGAYCNAVVSPGNGRGLALISNQLNTVGANAIRYTGIYMQGVDSGLVSQNTIANFDGATGEDDRGIWLATGTRNTLIERNNINTIKYTGTGGYGAYGIAVSTGTLNANIVLLNNLVSNLSGDGWTYLSVLGDNTHGMYLFSTQSGIYAYYNSINLEGNTLNQTNALSTGICVGTGTVADLKNNIINNNLGLLGSTGFGSTGIFLQSATTQLNSSNYNDIFVNPTGTGAKSVGLVNATGYTDLASWQTASGMDLNSISASPQFNSLTDLQPLWTSPVLAAGNPITGITTDYTGATRSATTPSIGAYENGLIVPLAGDYYIPKGSNPNGFNSLYEGINSLNIAGVSGEVRFLIDNDLSEIGANLLITRNDLTSTNHLIIKPAPTKTPTITITGCTATAGATQYTGIALSGASYVTFDGSNTVDGTTRDLTIAMNDSVNGRIGFTLFGNTDFIVFKNLNIKYNIINATSMTGRGIYANGQASGVADSLIIENCKIGDNTYAPAYSISITGSSGSLLYASKIHIKNNELYGIMRSVYFFYGGLTGTTSEISGNVINSAYAPTSANVVWGMLFNTYAGTFNIHNNKLNKLVSATTGTEGIYGIGTLSGQSGVVMNIFNNFLGGDFQHNGTGIPSGIDVISFQDNIAQANVYHNTIVLNNMSKTASARMTGVRWGGTASVNLLNNIIINEKDASVAYTLYSAGGTFTSNFNDLYVSGANANIGFANSVALQTFQAWKDSTGKDANSVNVSVPFTSALDFHIADNTSTPIESGATPIAWITTDIDGQNRNNSTPDIGADEFNGIALLAAPTDLVAVGDTNAVLINWVDNSTTELGFYIERKNGDTLSVDPFVLIDSVSVDVVNYTDFGREPNTTYTYRVRAYNLLAFSAYSNEATATTIVPVELTSFVANINSQQISLSWSTATELNNHGFEVERKLNDDWQKIAFIQGNGTTTDVKNYSYNDQFKFQSFQGTVQYRLKQIDYDGTYSYSKVASVEVDFTPKEYTLYQNYPNPFNPSTTIKFALPFDSEVRIVVYNLLGEQVDVIFDQVKEVGYHNVNFNASSLASGVYIYSIEAKSIDGLKNYSSVKKMMLVK